MVIFTDGEDQESEPIAAARKAHEETGVRIFTVGLGDMDKRLADSGRVERSPRISSTTICSTTGSMVWSKLNGDMLRQVATETDGAYVPAGTKQVNMADVYHNYIAGVEQTEFETARINQYEARFQWFLVPALVFLLLEIVLTTWPVRDARKNEPRSRRIRRHEPRPRQNLTYRNIRPQHERDSKDNLCQLSCWPACRRVVRALGRRWRSATLPSADQRGE